MATPPLKRRRLRFSLRALLVFVLVLSVPLGWVAWKVQKARKQREAVEAIVEAGGRVTYDYEISNAPPKYRKPHVPEWQVELLGVDFYCDVKIVDCGSQDFGDYEAKHVRKLRELELLHLDGTQVSDDGLKHLSGLTRLTGLDLSGTRVTDSGLSHLGGLTELKRLRLEGTEVTSEGALTLLESLPHCRITY